VGDHDEVVTPIPSYKFAATSQSLTGAVAPLLLRVDYDAGYGPGVPTAKQIAVETDQLTFLLTALRSPR
jgi:prolyl oligopeptidase